MSAQPYAWKELAAPLASALPKPAAFSNVDWDIFRSAEGLEVLQQSDPTDQFLAAALTEPWFTAEQMQDYARAAVLRATA